MQPGSPPSGTVTFLFTDIQGSTRLWETQPDIMRMSLARHDALVRAAIEARGGLVFKTVGDAFCTAFPTAAGAIEAALDVQTLLRREPWPPETPIKVRMALHTGAVESRENDYFGPPVNRVARLLSAAHGGQAILSQSCFELARDAPPDGAAFKDLGSHQLKDLARPEQVYQLLHAAFEEEFPPLLSVSYQPNNLPLQLTSFIGREAELERVKSLLDKSRLVTLTGSGGSGKTRLGIQAAAEMLDEHSDGVWLIELAAAGDEEGLVRAASEALSVPDAGHGSPAAALVDRIRHKNMLLVLDNCEHLVSECARFADLLLRSCPGLKILATSREALGIAGEATMRVPPLSLPARNAAHTAESLSQYASVRLFIDRALLADPNFTVTNSSAPALASICCQLDGIPLAVELAAARVRSLSLEQIADRLDRRFSLLTGGSRAALPRQKTLRALIDWSYDLLQPLEKKVFQGLAVFSGSWSLEAAESVCEDRETEPWEVSDTVLALVDKSLVTLIEHNGQNRFHFLESIREYALERLAASGEQDDKRQRHFEHFCALTDAALPHLRGPDQAKWLKALDLETDNLRAALQTGLGTQAGLSMASGLFWFWYLRGRLTEGRFWLDSHLERAEGADPATLAECCSGVGVFAETQGDWDASLQAHGKALAISRQLGDRFNTAKTLNNIGNVHASQGQFEQAVVFWREALAIWEGLDKEGLLPNRLGPAAAIDNLGNAARLRGDLKAARGLYEQALAFRREAGSHSLTAASLLNMGFLALDEGDHVSAGASLREGLRMSFEVGWSLESAYFMLALAALHPPQTACLLLGQFDHLRDEMGFLLGPDDAAMLDSVTEQIRQHLSLAEFEEIMAAGRAMPLGQAIELALSD